MLALPCAAMQTFGVAQNSVAHNIANVNTVGFEPRVARLASVEPLRGVTLDTIMKDGSHGTPLEREFVSMTAYQHAYDANATVVKTYDSMMGTMLDMLA